MSDAEEIKEQLKKLAETVNNIDTLLIGNKYSKNRGLIDQVNTNKKDINHLKRQSLITRIKTGSLVAGGAFIAQLIFKFIIT